MNWARPLAFAVALLSCAGIASAEERQSLIGYEEFAFGMSEDELRSLVTIKRSDPYEGGAWLETSTEASFGGEAYSYSFYVNDGALYQINLVDERESSEAQCRQHFDKVRAAMIAKYRDPEPKSDEPSLPGVVGHEEFNFADGSNITLVAIWFPDTCATNIAHISADRPF